MRSWVAPTPVSLSMSQTGATQLPGAREPDRVRVVGTIASPLGGPSGLSVRGPAGDTVKPADALGVRWMLLEAVPGALAAVKVAVYVVPAGIVFVPLLQTLHRKVPSV